MKKALVKKINTLTHYLSIGILGVGFFWGFMAIMNAPNEYIETILGIILVALLIKAVVDKGDY